MPMDRPELFDVVIVDEASQSGLEAVLLAHVAERMVVVGDDKQVSPSHVGLDQDQVFAFQERMLRSAAERSDQRRQPRPPACSTWRRRWPAAGAG